MRIGRRSDALLIGAALLVGCALTARRHEASDADAQPCSISAVQLARSPERTVHEVVERTCPATLRALRAGREIRVQVLRGGEPASHLGGATVLRTLHPRQVSRVRILPNQTGAPAPFTLVLVELREP